MSFRSQRIALWAIVAVTGSLFAQALWIPTARAQSAATESGEVVPVPISQLEQIEKELQYLRAHDAERQAWEAVGKSAAANRPHYGGQPSTSRQRHPRLGSTAASLPAVVCQRRTLRNGCQCPDCLYTAGGACIDCPRATTRDPWVNAKIFGAAKLDAIYNTSRPQAPGTPFFLVPKFAGGFSTEHH